MAVSRKSPSTSPVPAAIAACLERYLATGQTVAVGFSGGLDSVVLLHGLRALDRPVSAVHVHHGLSANADRWSDFCRHFCDDLNIPLRIEKVTVAQDSADGLEAAARRARYLAFDRLAADWLLLAHHQDDRAETMLFNLLRGAGVRGAGALRERNGRVLRPLLACTRRDLHAYAVARNLCWVEDETNADTRFSRNFLRHRIFPELESRFPGASARLSAAAAHFAEAADLLDDLAQSDLAGDEASFPVAVARLAALSEPRARNVLRFLFARAGIGIPSQERLAEALRQCLSAAADRHPAVAFGEFVLRRRAGRIFLDKA
jgi:tRNA(Ile)-lysidine synthase